MKRPVLLLLISILLFMGSKAQINKSIDTTRRFQMSLHEPASFAKTGEYHYFIDFGKDAFGTIVLNIHTSRPDTIIVHLGEKIIEKNKIDRNPGGSIRYQKITLPVDPSITAYTLQLPADKRNTSPGAILLPRSVGVITPFRYCELENYKPNFAPAAIKQKVFNVSFNDLASSFTSSDTILNKVWDLCKYSIKATSFCGYYVDGDRERIPYEADALINQLSHYSVDQEYGMARRTNEYFINHPTWPTEWILQTVLLFYNDYLYTGKNASLLKNWDALKAKTLIDLEREDGLVSTKSSNLTNGFMGKIGFADRKQRIRDIVDWPGGERDGYEMKEINTVVNAFHYMSLKLMADLSGYLGKKEEAALFAEKATQVRKTINDKLFDKEKGLYVDGENSTHSSIHANLFPLAFDLVPAESVKKVTAFVKSRGMACSVYGAQFLLEGLYKTAESDYAFNLMTAQDDRGWWNMIRAGSTITMEAWDMKYKPNSDWNHAWGTAPANIITRYMWGIQPLEPGFTKAMIKPQLSNLSYSTIKAPTPLGPIQADYKKNSDALSTYKIELPLNLKADFILLPDDHSSIYLNGKKINPVNNTIQLKSGLNLIEIKK